MIMQKPIQQHKNMYTGNIIKCMQINLQHSRNGTDSTVQIIHQHSIDVLFIQEPYIISNKVVGIPRNYSTFAAGTDRKRATLVITNDCIASLTIHQLSDEDNVILHLTYGSLNFDLVVL